MLNSAQNKSSCMEINSTDFNLIYDICKNMKMDYFMVTINNMTNTVIEITGIDSTFSYISYCIINNSNFLDSTFSFITSKDALSNLSMLLATPTEKMYIYEEYITNDSKNDFLAINRPVIGYRELDVMTRVITYLRTFDVISELHEYGSINEDESILQMTSSKVSDNIIPYIKDRFYMIIYKGIIPMCKSDKLSLNIYDLHDGTNRFVSDFILRKKKLDYHYLFMYKNLI